MKFKTYLASLGILLMLVVGGCSGTEFENVGDVEQTQVVGNEEVKDSKVESVEGELKGEKSKGEVSSFEGGELKVSYIDVGQADATLLELKEGEEEYTVLIDAGDVNKSDAVNYIKSVGVTDIDVLVGTHPHADHIGQMDKVINEFNVGEVWMSGDTSNSQVFSRVLNSIELSGVGYNEPRAGEVYDIGGMELTVLSPETVNGSLNDGSVAVKVKYGEIDFVFMGDAESKAEQGILNRGSNVKADILKLGHHGSDTSTTGTFLKAVNPEVAIYSAGKGNSYGHPSKSVVERVKGSGIDLYGTDVHGTVIVTTDGVTYKIDTVKTGEVEGKGEIKETTPEVVVKGKGEPVGDGGSCVNINTATADQLKGIKHIGDVRVNDLVQGRPYQKVEELTKINGIGDARIKDIVEQGLACVK